MLIDAASIADVFDARIAALESGWNAYFRGHLADLSEEANGKIIPQFSPPKCAPSSIAFPL